MSESFVTVSSNPQTPTAFHGALSAVTTATGTYVPSGGTYTVRTKHPSKWGIVSASGTVNVRVTLLKGN